MIQIEATGHPAITAFHIGSVTDVIAAKLPDKVTQPRFDAREFAYGFELATPKEIDSVGEALLVNGNCYATSTAQGSADYFKTLCGPTFHTGGIFLIPKGAQPSYRARFSDPKNPLSLIECYNALYAKIKQPLAFVGFISFATFHATAIGAPPIDGRSIFENKEVYFPRPPIQEKDTYGFLVGAMADYSQISSTPLKQGLNTVLYRNPTEKDSPLTHHAHILTLKQPVSSPEQITPSIADKMLHLFAQGSTVSHFAWDIFTLHTVEDYL